MSWPLHGSNPQYVYEHLCEPMPDHVLDFSTNINPFGPPAGIAEKWTSWLHLIQDYPDPSGKELVEYIAIKEQLTPTSVLLGNGGAEIISLVAGMLSGKRILIIQPNFSEYERMCAANACEISYLTLSEWEWKIPLEQLQSRLANIDAVFLSNPNNPAGMEYPEQQLSELAKACHKHNCFLVIDEAFYDFLDIPVTMAAHTKTNSHVIVMRSLTKMYAIAGLRLGYVLAEPAIINQLKQSQTHWSINAIALAAGKECLRAESHTEMTRAYVSRERNRIMTKLQQFGYLISASKVNFYLLRDPVLDEQLPLFQFLLRKGIVARHTANYRGLEGRWLRFAIKEIEDNEKLLEALAEWKDMG